MPSWGQCASIGGRLTGADFSFARHVGATCPSSLSTVRLCLAMQRSIASLRSDTSSVLDIWAPGRPNFLKSWFTDASIASRRLPVLASPASMLRLASRISATSEPSPE
jgi:hypothetical protein